jgi:hypothetical protein
MARGRLSSKGFQKDHSDSTNDGFAGRGHSKVDFDDFVANGHGKFNLDDFVGKGHGKLDLEDFVGRGRYGSDDYDDCSSPRGGWDDCCGCPPANPPMADLVAKEIARMIVAKYFEKATPCAPCEPNGSSSAGDLGPSKPSDVKLGTPSMSSDMLATAGPRSTGKQEAVALSEPKPLPASGTSDGVAAHSNEPVAAVGLAPAYEEAQPVG